MTLEVEVLHAEFPRSVRGYSVTAVDDFVEQIGARLSGIQKQLDHERSRAEGLQAQLAKANADVAAYLTKQSALANAIVSMEQRKSDAADEREALLAEARAEANQCIAEAQSAANQIMSEAHERCKAVESDLEVRKSIETARLRDLGTQFEGTVERVRQTLEAQISLLPRPGEAAFAVTGFAYAQVNDSQRDAELEVAQ